MHEGERVTWAGRDAGTYRCLDLSPFEGTLCQRLISVRETLKKVVCRILACFGHPRRASSWSSQFAQIEVLNRKAKHSSLSSVVSSSPAHHFVQIEGEPGSVFTRVDPDITVRPRTDIRQADDASFTGVVAPDFPVGKPREGAHFGRLEGPCTRAFRHCEQRHAFVLVPIIFSSHGEIGVSRRDKFLLPPPQLHVLKVYIPRHPLLFRIGNRENDVGFYVLVDLVIDPAETVGKKLCWSGHRSSPSFRGCDGRPSAISSRSSFVSRGERSLSSPRCYLGNSGAAIEAPRLLHGRHPTPDRLRRSDPPPSGEGGGAPLPRIDANSVVSPVSKPLLRTHGDAETRG